MGKNEDDAVLLDDTAYIGTDPIYQNAADETHVPVDGEDEPDVVERVKELDQDKHEVEDVVVEDDAFEKFAAESSVEAMKGRATNARNADVLRGADVTSTTSEGISTDDEDDRPTQSDLKAEWVDYAVSQGANREDAEALTKEQLIAQYG